MTDQEFMPRRYVPDYKGGSTAWEAPSNIALVKYWGKKEPQLPANPSLSFTLSQAVSKTVLTYRRREKLAAGFSFEINLEGRPEDSFRPKIQVFFERINRYLPFLKEFHFHIQTSNSFPHSSGIASSASGMAALALCLCDAERGWTEIGEADFLRKASFLARLGSGSAARSVGGPLSIWGEHPAVPGSSDLYALNNPFELHPVFHDFRDTVLLVESGRKAVSSSRGHNLMQGHPFATARFAQAYDHISILKEALTTGDLDAFMALVEQEALTLHALMMSGKPGFLLMKPNTLEILARVREYRQASQVPVCFTLDAGANVHLLYPESVQEQVGTFIDEALVEFCQNEQYICDQIGFGAKKMYIH